MEEGGAVLLVEADLDGEADSAEEEQHRCDGGEAEPGALAEGAVRIFEVRILIFDERPAWSVDRFIHGRFQKQQSPLRNRCPRFRQSKIENRKSKMR
jgi:ssDNA-binding Zn-finger/Zn-ribbon topoisomerase 1